MRRLLPLLVLLVACQSQERFHSSVLLGGKEVPAAVLNLGARTYSQHCASCHGETGAGDGPKAAGLSPPPTDLRRGLYKFASVDAGALPTDTDLQRTIRKGLEGTAMAGTALSTDETIAVAQYIKTFSPRWGQEAVAPVPRADPVYASAVNRQKIRSKAEWVELGDRVYHIEAKCWSCHPAYETKEHLYEWSGRTISTFRADLYEAKPTMNAFSVRTLAPDFTRDTLKTGTSEEALFRVISVGIGGSGMGPSRHTLEDEQMWALVAYVKSLTALKQSGGAAELRSRLEAQMDWLPGR
jgi:mono/diheme cytochrome c family protein